MTQIQLPNSPLHTVTVYRDSRFQGKAPRGLAAGIYRAHVYGYYIALGYYYSYISVGSPPQVFSVILDTGSPRTVIPCAECSGCGSHMDPKYNLSLSTSGKRTQCRDRACLDKSCTDEGSSDCGFTIGYAEGSSLRGVQVDERVCLGRPELECSMNDSNWVDFSVGCATTMTNLFRSQLADGIMGLNDDEYSTIVDAMRDHHNLQRDMFSLCLSEQGGLLTVGGYNASLHREPVQWTSQKTNWGSSFVVELTGLSLGDFGGTPHLEAWVGSSLAMIDSGTTYTYLRDDIFASLSSKFLEMCRASSARCLGKITVSDPRALACFALQLSDEPSVEEIEGVLQTFPNITLGLQSEVTLIISPFEYFTPKNDSTLVTLNSSPNHRVCVGFYPSGKTSRNVFGMNALLNYDVIFDREVGRVGFAHADCFSVYDPRCGEEDTWNCFYKQGISTASPSKSASASPTMRVPNSTSFPTVYNQSISPIVKTFLGPELDSESPAAVEHNITSTAVVIALIFLAIGGSVGAVLWCRRRLHVDRRNYSKTSSDQIQDEFTVDCVDDEGMEMQRMRII